MHARVVLVAMILAAACVSALDASSGRVVYLRCPELAASTADGAYTPTEGSVDLVEADLATHKRSTLLRGFFKGEFESVRGVALAVSPDGRYIAIGVQPTLSVSGDDIQQTPNGLLLWNRKTGRTAGIYPHYRYESLSWSPSGRYLAIIDESEGLLRVYDAPTGKIRTYSNYRGVSCVTWAAKREELLVVVPAPDKSSTVYVQPIAGRRKVLFGWPSSVDNITQFGNGAGCAFSDDTGVLSRSAGGRHRRLPICRSHNDLWGVSLTGQPGSAWMAALAFYSFGEPHVNDHIALYVFRSGGSVCKRIAKWETTFLDVQPTGGSITLVQRAEWMRSQPAVVVSGKVVWGGEAYVDNRTDRFLFWKFDVTKGGNGTRIFDTGPGCLSAVWWAG